MADVARLLARAPTRSFRATLARAVASEAIFAQDAPASPDFLFTSGKENRFNLAETQCLYMAEDEATALAEYRRQFEGLRHGAKQPVTLFFAEVRLASILDLAEPATRKVLGVTLRELNADWGGGLAPTIAQEIGNAVAKQSRITAIRYQSIAAARLGATGYNLAIFKEVVYNRDFIRILGPTKKPLQKWPY